MSQKQSICIVDDDEIYKFFVKKILEIKGLADNVLTFPDGEEAYNYIKENRGNPNLLPDIIFLDINMPVMDGFLFIEEYTKIKHEINKEIAIYMVTSSIDPIDLERSKKYTEIKGFITKPISAEVLEKIIKKLRS
ncbi:response regulator [Polaribacter filamentus]|uniref:Response regulator n=1 Tax=Polaribacter filamentus TaxID=53483 RepID=A0A2S7KZW3_9FLAO|nr:response regulator [Polaribacter filamentus]PQB08202.1 response regulator [Polaribacter filamentus]